MDFILFFSFHTVRVEVENKKWKLEKKKRLHVLHAPTLPAKYCFTSHVSACQNEARGISASTQHISPHTHTLVQLKMKEQHKKAPKHILHFITIKAESGGTASAFRLIQELYFFVYPSWLTKPHQPLIISHLCAVGQWFSWSMNQFSSHVSRLRVCLDCRKWEWADGPAVVSHRKWIESTVTTKTTVWFSAMESWRHILVEE